MFTTSASAKCSCLHFEDLKAAGHHVGGENWEKHLSLRARFGRLVSPLWDLFFVIASFMRNLS